MHDGELSALGKVSFICLLVPLHSYYIKFLITCYGTLNEHVKDLLWNSDDKHNLEEIIS